jgi:hypothetical protein
VFLKYQLFLLITLTLVAAGPMVSVADSSDPIQVQVLDPEMKISQADLKNAEIHPPSNIHTPAPKLRDKVFADSGVAPYIQDFHDHLERDQLYNRSGIYPIDRMAETYPEIPKERLEKLRRLVLRAEIIRLKTQGGKP